MVESLGLTVLSVSKSWIHVGGMDGICCKYFYELIAEVTVDVNEVVALTNFSDNAPYMGNMFLPPGRALH